MKNLLIILAIIISLTTANAQQLTKFWEVSGLEAPESAVYYKGNYYFSNINGQPAEKNGLGYITKIDRQGKIVDKKWAIGFNAPKGLAIYGSELFVADIDIVYVVNLNSGKVIRKYEAEGATFLNDIEVASNGTVYISDTFGGNAIYRIENGKISLWLKDDALDYPNGLLLKGEELLVATWGKVTNPETFGTDTPGKLLSVNLKSKSIKEITSSFGNLDGLVPSNDGGYIVSDWIAGRLVSISKNGKTCEILDLDAGSADLTLLKKENMLLVPQMLDGKLVAYKIDW